MNILKLRILDTIKFSNGNVFVVEEAGATAAVVALLDDLHGELRSVKFVDLDATPSDAHVEFFRAGSTGAVVVWSARRTFPRELAHVAYVWFKGDGLVDPASSVTRDPQGQRAPKLLVLLSRPAWEGLPAPDRARLSAALSAGGHWFQTNAGARRPLSAIG